MESSDSDCCAFLPGVLEKRDPSYYTGGIETTISSLHGGSGGL